MLTKETVNLEKLAYPNTLLHVLQQIRHEVVSEGTTIFEKWRSLITRDAFIPSAENLAYYLALRRHDMRDIQLALTPWG
ncbi:MAG: hypothetical protein AB4062_20410, partial [Crocosphaera sp.]